MKASVNTKKLLASLSYAVKLFPPRTFLAMEENICVMSSGIGLAFNTVYGRTAICASIEPGDDCLVSSEGAALLPARLLLDIVRHVEDETIVLESIGEKSFSVRWSTGHSTLPAFDMKDYPEQDIVPSKHAVTVRFPAQELASSLAATSYACSAEDRIKVLQGVCVNVGPDGAEFAASDQHKLVVHALPGVTAPEPVSFIINRLYAPLVADMCKEADDITMSVDGDRAIFHAPGKVLSLDAVTGRFPDYNSVIPKTNRNLLSIPRMDFVSVIRRVALFSGGNQRNILLNFRSGAAGAELEVSSYGGDLFGSAVEKLNVDYSGDDLHIGFSSQHLQEILSKMKCDAVTVRIEDGRHAALIAPKEETHPTRAVLMPVATL